MNYPDDWPCKCGHIFKDHGISKYNPNRVDCCLLLHPTRKLDNGDPHFLDDCQTFEPVDNLTLVEMIANAGTSNL